jgi:CRP-like cAMP-binding protein
MPEKRCNHLYLICSGTAYGYYPGEHEEKVVALAYQRDLVTGLGSFNTNLPATFGIKAYSDIQALSVSYGTLRELLDKHRPLEQWFLYTAFNIIAGMEIRLASTAMPAEERFDRLIKSSPHVFNLFPQKLIASYLNMTPETLSRLRKQHALTS